MPSLQRSSGLLFAFLSVAACKGEATSGAAPSPVAAPPIAAPAPAAPPAAGVTGAPTTLPIAGFTVEVTVPVGWKQAPFGEGVAFQHTDPDSYATSTLFITPSCQGSCGRIAENVAGYLATQRATHEEMKYQVTVVDDQPLASGGRQFHLKAVREREELAQVVAIHHQPGWTVPVTCSGTLLGADRVAADQIMGWCRALKATPR